MPLYKKSILDELEQCNNKPDFRNVTQALKAVVAKVGTKTDMASQQTIKAESSIGCIYSWSQWPNHQEKTIITFFIRVFTNILYPRIMLQYVGSLLG